MKVTAFRLYGESNRKQITKRLHVLLESWSNEWFEKSNLELEIRNVTGNKDSLLQQIKGPAQLLGAVDSEVQIIITTNGKLNPFLQLLPAVKTERGSDPALGRQIQDAIAVRCAQDLSHLLEEQVTAKQELTSGTEISSDTLAQIFRPGSGWAVLTIEKDDFDLPVLLGPQILRRLGEFQLRPQPRGGLPDAISALASQRLTLRAELGSTSLTIGEIENLAIGDVVKLDQSFDTPIRVSVGKRQVVAEGQLGLQSGSKAVKLQSRTA